MLNVVILNGGRGASSLIPNLLAEDNFHVTSVVNAYDDGKSTGDIRRLFEMLGPSDLRKVQELMLNPLDSDYEASKNLYQYRYPNGSNREKIIRELEKFSQEELDTLVGISFQKDEITDALRVFVREFIVTLKIIEKATDKKLMFGDCSIMNCIYAGAYLHFNRNIEAATVFFGSLFKLRGSVLPSSTEEKTLVALRENGEMLYCEADIVELRSNVRIKDLYLINTKIDKDKFDKLDLEQKKYFLDRHDCFVPATNRVLASIKNADIIIYAAGTQHSSLYPTYMTNGLPDAIAENKKALKVFLTNIGADYETPSYKASDYIKGAFRYLSKVSSTSHTYDDFFNAILVNDNKKIDENYVEFDASNFKDIPIELIIKNFESDSDLGKHNASLLISEIIKLYKNSIYSSLRKY